MLILLEQTAILHYGPAGMADPAGGSISATNQLLMQTLLVLQGQRGHQQQAQSTPATTVGGLGAPAQQRLISDAHAAHMQPAPSAMHPARDHLSTSGTCNLEFASQGVPYSSHGHYGYAQPALSRQQPEQHMAEQHYDSMREPGQLPPQHQLTYPPQQQYSSHLHQQPPSVLHSRQPLSTYAMASFADGASGGSTQWGVSGSGGVWNQGESSLASSTEVPHGFQAQEPPIKRMRTTMPGEGDCVGAVDGRDVGKQEAAKLWSWEDNAVETASHAHRIEAAWSGTVCPVSTTTLRRMRKRAQAMVQGTSMPGEPGARGRSIAATVKRGKAANKARTEQRKAADGALAAEDHASILSAGACTSSETGATESTTLCQESETGSNSVPERSSGGSGVSESNASGNCSGADSGNGHRSNASECNTAGSSSGDSRSNLSESMSAGDSSGDSWSNASERQGSRSTVSESNSADSGDSQSNASESNSADSSGDSHDNASESNGGDGSSGHESSSNDGGRDGGSSGGARESSSDRGSNVASDHDTSSSESEARDP